MDEQFDEELMDLELIDEDIALDRIVRRSFRVPLKDNPDCLVLIGGELFPLIDISPHGACFASKNEMSFQVNQVLHRCRLTLDGNEIRDIDCKVVRLSPGNGKNILYGIEWINITGDQKQALEAICEFFKKELLNKEKNDNSDAAG